ncbi:MULTISPECIES: tRNA (adenosine(37)-N6)-threonylcarbamoyltransferase complex dimerization subunit type 1 TsaB [unclassified Ectothiorhodospira]|uniref:tRNA (adenosine(37)-N6)-threonylcarbamoyltransferase complex dimerization subunit type 1 TsaB n=1 Tax=unclassified Ectothiorhodospira TaxID=2684909 RepID=UPI001EE7A759|nr:MULTISPECIES: tRNA (adenosine(37)-N6)-threonylcarbamoyltransferase complex dimerization subunit type 1 TsaB [unclassified Ectothiorhodospira]MCG5516128.1 tRNA (adenosine(37)-N6)-threonylcarbamoyltransferase complex dimerization subunit type 1 TsaB [Ectothiorhodospira sp. 9100]MCG5518595.1 tRNA (adenosine(37)-N6)-threonylcarbamoyltransferase complex dimerization subunit type 1 TsaB [Ectothiorhodospira sp. 9905]
MTPPTLCKLLAIETSTEACSAALWVDGRIHRRFQEAPRAHARLILPMMEAVLADAGITLGQLDALAFGRGPGAFTGVRVATGVIQGVAFGADLPVVPISTLAALAQQRIDAGARQVLAALDARMGEVYWGAFKADVQGLANPVGLEGVCPPLAVPQPPEGHWVPVGRGWSAYQEALAQRLDMEAEPPWNDCLPSATEVVRLAVRDWAAGASVPADQAMPVYLRDQVANKPRQVMRPGTVGAAQDTER